MMADSAKLIQDQFSQLPHGTWRDILFPISDRTHRFAHEGTDHRIIYRNGVAVEMTGAGPRIITYTIPFREGITKGPYFSLFSKTMLEFWRAFHDDKSPGTLYDPIYGELLCTPQEWDESTDVTKRDGLDIRCSFKEHSPADGTAETAPADLTGIQSDAERLDASVAVLPWPVQQPPPDPTGNIFSVVAGVIQEGNWMMSKMRASVAEVIMRYEEVEDAAAEAEENATVGAGFVRQEARRARVRAIRVNNYPDRESTTTTRQVARNSVSTIFTEAARAGMDLQDFLLLNPQLARSVEIPAGTLFWIRKLAA